jgi:hypothetical protein
LLLHGSEGSMRMTMRMMTFKMSTVHVIIIGAVVQPSQIAYNVIVCMCKSALISCDCAHRKQSDTSCVKYNGIITWWTTCYTGNRWQLYRPASFALLTWQLSTSSRLQHNAQQRRISRPDNFTPLKFRQRWGRTRSCVGSTAFFFIQRKTG